MDDLPEPEPTNEQPEPDPNGRPDPPGGDGMASDPSMDVGELEAMDFDLDSDPSGRVDEDMKEMAERGETERLEDLRDCQTMIYQMYSGAVAMAEAESEHYHHTDEEKKVVGKLGGRILQRRLGTLGPNADLILLGGYLAATWGTKHAQRIKAGDVKDVEEPEPNDEGKAESEKDRPRDDRKPMSETLSAIQGE